MSEITKITKFPNKELDHQHKLFDFFNRFSFVLNV